MPIIDDPISITLTMNNFMFVVGWRFMALRLTSVNVLSWYGGISHVKVNDYYNAKM